VGGIYYLGIIKEMFFSQPDYKINTVLENLTLKGYLANNKTVVGVGSAYANHTNLSFNYKNIVISSPIAFVISTITLVILLFLFMNKE
jgi:NADH-ubiquinone oxidoreductase chain 2